MNVENNITKHIQVFQFVEKEFCVELITEIQNNDWYLPAKRIGNKKPSPSNSISEPAPYSLILQSTLLSIVKNYMSHFSYPWLNLEQQLAPIRFIKFDKKQCIELCYDYQSIYNNNTSSTLTLFGNLNDEYKGGELYICGEPLSLSFGQVVVFPTSFLCPYEVKVVSSGTKYSYLTWI